MEQRMIPMHPSRAVIADLAEQLVQRVDLIPLLTELQAACQRKADVLQRPYPGAAQEWGRVATDLGRAVRRMARVSCVFQ